MARKNTINSIERLRVLNVNEKIERAVKDIAIKIMNNEIDFEEEPVHNDGIYDIHEYYAEYNDLEIYVQRLKKTNGINPRFNMKILFDNDTVNIGGGVAAKSYNMITNKLNSEDHYFTNEDADILLKALQ